MIRNLLEALKSRQVPLFSDAKVGLQRLYLILYIAILAEFVADLIFSYFRGILQAYIFESIHLMFGGHVFMEVLLLVLGFFFEIQDENKGKLMPEKDHIT